MGSSLDFCGVTARVLRKRDYLLPLFTMWKLGFAGVTLFVFQVNLRPFAFYGVPQDQPER